MDASSGRSAGGWPAVSYETWRSKVAPSGGEDFDRLVSTVDGELRIEPLYSADHAVAGQSSGLPGVAPFLRGPVWPAAGSSWRTGAEIDDLDLGAARAEVGRAIEEGATLLRLRLGCTQRGLPPGSRIGGAPDFASLLGAIDPLEVELHLDAGSGAVAAAAALLGALASEEPSRPPMSGCLGLDPLSELAASGAIAGGVRRRFDLVAQAVDWCSPHAPGLRAARISSLPLEEAGAGAALALGFALASGVEYLRQLERRGVTPERASAALCMTCGVGRDVFVEISRLRAWRACWHRILSVIGVEAPAPAAIHLVSLRRRRTAHDAPVNLLRGTLETFIAAVGGAESLTLLAYDERRRDRSADGRRRARTTQAVAREEARLDWVADPAGGSWYVEALTRQLAEKAWTHFQAIEERGGALAALVDGSLLESVAGQLADRREEISRRRLALTGVSRFALPDEPPVALRKPASEDQPPVAPREPASEVEPSVALRKRASEDQPPVALREPASEDEPPAGAGECGFEELVAQARSGAGMDQLRAAAAGAGEATRCTPLVAESEAAAFEDLRGRSDRHRAATGDRPRVLLVTLGALAEHGPRRTFAINLLAAGGIGFIEAVPGALPSPPPNVAVLCGSDERLRAQAAEVAAALGASGVSRVLLAGAADPPIAGVETGLCLREGINVVATLSTVADLLGVAP